MPLERCQKNKNITSRKANTKLTVSRQEKKKLQS